MTKKRAPKTVRAQERKYLMSALAAALCAAGCGAWLLMNPSNGFDPRWMETATNAAATLPCNIRSIDGAGHSLQRLATEVDADYGSPLLLRAAMTGWGAVEAWRDRGEFLRRHGNMSIGVGVGFRMSTRPNEDGLLYSWAGPGAGAGKYVHEVDEARELRHRFEEEARAGVPPRLPLHQLVAYMRNRSLPHDSYTFTPVDDSALANDVPELQRLWALVRDDEERRVGPQPIIHGTLFGLGGEGSGIMFHGHEFALSALFAGHKRWFIYDDDAHRPDNSFMTKQMREAQRRDPTFALNSMRAWAADVLPLPDMQRWWHQVGWECVQGPGDVLYVPKALHHGTVNLDETISLSIQGSKWKARSELDRASAAALHRS